MPVGLTKAFALSFLEDIEQTDPTRMYIHGRLFRNRLLFLLERLTSELSNIIIGGILVLDHDDNTKDQFLWINCTGGSLIGGLGIFDAMDAAKAKVHAICLAKAYSTGALVLSGGLMPERLAFPRARILLHEPACGPSPKQTLENFLDTVELWMVRNSMLGLLIEKTGQPPEVVVDHVQRDVFMNVKKAKLYGIIDEVVRPHSRVSKRLHEQLLASKAPKVCPDPRRRSAVELEPSTETAGAGANWKNPLNI